MVRVISVLSLGHYQILLRKRAKINTNKVFTISSYDFVTRLMRNLVVCTILSFPLLKSLLDPMERCASKMDQWIGRWNN